MRCVEFTVQWLTFCAAWSFGVAQDITSDDDFDPLDFEEAQKRNYAQDITSDDDFDPLDFEEAQDITSDDDFDPLDFEEAQQYLDKYNYFHGNKPRALKNPSDIRIAIEEMQDFNGILRTGRLDKETMAKIRAPRCGVSDFVGVRKNAHLVRRRRRYALAGQKWPMKALSYRILNYTPDLSRDHTRLAIQSALKTWSDTTPLTFREVTRGEADILIQFARGEHGDGYPFDGRGGTLAHAYFPGRGIGGDAHFDDHEYFSHGSYRGTNLFLVAAHELGHSLGLAHSSNPRALMAPYYQGYQPNFKLPVDDIKGIQRLYGKAPTNKPRPPVPPKGVPPKKPGKPPSGPAVCSSTFQAAMNMDSRIYVFQGSNYWRIDENRKLSPGYPKPITSYWKGAPTNIDAAFVLSTENAVFFKGNIWYEFQGREVKRKGTLESLGLPATVRRIDAAIMWEGNSMPYFFSGNHYYRFNERTGRVDSGYPKQITPNWKKIPGNVGAAFSFEGFTYFLKGQSYYKFDDVAIKKVAGPLDFGAEMLGCTGTKNFKSDSNLANHTKAKLVTVLLPVILTIGSLLL